MPVLCHSNPFLASVMNLAVFPRTLWSLEENRLWMYFYIDCVIFFINYSINLIVKFHSTLRFPNIIITPIFKQ